MMLSDNSIEDRIAELAENQCVVEEDLKNLRVSFEARNPIFRRELERVDIPSYDSILVTETRPGTEGLCSDSRSMITMLLCRDLQKQAALDGAVTFGRQVPSNEATVISEILDPRTAELIKLAKTDDHIVSNELISMALGQCQNRQTLAPLCFIHYDASFAMLNGRCASIANMSSLQSKR